MAINRSASTATLHVPLAGFVPTGTCSIAYAVGGTATARRVGDMLDLTLPPLGAAVCVTPAGLDLAPPAAPAGLHVTGEGDGQVSLEWSAVAGAAGYDVYRSPLSGGGWVTGERRRR